jgi:hypothetical protein
MPMGSPITEWGSRSKRTPSADLWLTVMKALGIPDSIAKKFPDVQDGRAHSYMLKS